MKTKNKIKLIALLLLCTLTNNIIAQKQSDLDLLYWNASNKITLEDFGIQSSNAAIGHSSASFSLEYNINGLGFLTKNFNKKVQHYMNRSASQIDTSGNVERYIQYQQTLFDLQEIYVRKFRKALRENRKELLFKTAIADELKQQIIDIDLPNRQAAYNNESNAAKDTEKQQMWQRQILKELEELKDFAYNR